jgi:acyl dehydratase
MSIHWQTLQRNPPLAPSYARAALQRKVTGEHLPDVGLRCWLRPDPEQLASYRQLCGFGEGGLLPATYPHVLAFPLQMQLLTSKAFPFPLLGLVHLRNRIRLLRPLGGISGVLVSVHVENLQPHEKGATFDLVTEVQDPLGPLWEEHSTMLCRGLKLEGQPATGLATPEVPLVEVRRWFAARDTGRRYARVSGDFNPIHLSNLSAKMFGFSQAIAHGMWSLAQSVAALREHLPVANFELDVQFRKPVRLPAELILSASAAGSSGRLQLSGRNELVHMTGGWEPLAAHSF